VGVTKGFVVQYKYFSQLVCFGGVFLDWSLEREKL